MSAVSRVSAFAKRRKLNGGSTAPTSESDDSSSVSLVKDARVSKAATRPVGLKKSLRQNPTEFVPLEKDHEVDDDENSFAPLVEAKAVSFIGTREIEYFEDDGCRVRLSKGQKCSLQGIAKLWVREGTVRIDGAGLFESHEEYVLFGATSGSCTEIVAQSKLAEFQLDSVIARGEALPSIANVPGKLGELGRRGVRSFHIPERAQEVDISSSDSTASIDSLITGVSSQMKSTATNDVGDPRILICGKRSTDTYRASIAVINHLLTCASDSRGHVTRRSGKLALLDLDYHSPAFSAPGTISITILRRPIFGPSYAQSLSYDAEQTNCLLASHYIEAIEDTVRPNLDLSTVQDLLQTKQNHLKNTPLIIRTGSWFAYVSSSEMPLLQKVLSPNLIVCIDAKKSSPYLDIAHSLSQSTSNPKSHPTNASESTTPTSILHHPIIPVATLSPLKEHKLQLQSHFRLYGSIANTPLWHRDPLSEIPLNRRLLLSTNLSKDSPRLSFIQIHGGVLRPQDIRHVLRQNLVVIVAIKTQIQISTQAHFGNDSQLNTESQYSQQRDLDDSHTHNASNESRPFLPIRKREDNQTLHFVGLAFVEEVEVQNKSLTLNTPVNMDGIKHYISLGCEIGLVLEKPDSDGRFGRHLLFS